MRRLYFAYAGLLDGIDDWTAVCRHASLLGFDGLLAEPSAGDIYDDEVAPGVSIAALAGLARNAGLALHLELRSTLIGRKSVQASGLAAHGAPTRIRDPRIRPAERDLIHAPRDADGAGRWGEALGLRMAELAKLGVAGFRCPIAGAEPEPALTQALASARSGSDTEDIALIAAPTRLDGSHRLAALGFEAICLPAEALVPPGRSAGLEDATRHFRYVLGETEALYGRRAARVTGDAVVGQRQAGLSLWANAGVLDGLVVPMGFEFGARERVVPGLAPRSSWRMLFRERGFDLSEDVISANAFMARRDGGARQGPVGIVAPQGSPIRAVVRRSGDRVRLAIVNRALDRSVACEPDDLTPAFGEYLPLQDLRGSAPDLGPGSQILLRPAEVRIMAGSRAPAIVGAAIVTLPTPDAAVAAARLVIEAVEPAVDGGRYAVKRIVGETVAVEVDAFGEGHDPIAVALQWRAADEQDWHEARMRPLGNDRYRAELPLKRVGRYVYTVEAWRDEFAIFRSELVKKHEAGLAVPLELEEGRRLVEAVLGGRRRDADRARLAPIARDLADGRGCEAARDSALAPTRRWR